MKNNTLAKEIERETTEQAIFYKSGKGLHYLVTPT